MKNKRKIVILITLIVISVGLLSGCNEKSSNGGKKEIETVNATLNSICLKSEDLEGNFEKTVEDYTNESYIFEAGNSPLSGQRILEGYNSTFKESEDSIIVQALIRCESYEKAKNFFDLIKSALEKNYPEESIDTIGEESYFFQRNISISGNNITSYTLFFRIGDVLVSLDGNAPNQASFIGYGKIIESNIMNAIEYID